MLAVVVADIANPFFLGMIRGAERAALEHGYTLLVGERPGRGNSSLIVLTVNDQELFEAPLPTRLDQMKELVAGAVETAQGYLVEAQSVARQLESGQRAPLEVY